MEILTIKDLTFSYPNAETPAVDGVSLSVRSGEFLVLCGQSGCGKTTLLRQCKPQLAPNGVKNGEILFEGIPLSELDERKSVSEIGFVLQSPEHQTVTDKVWHELAFGLENLGCDTPTIRRRVAETASFFGIQNWFHMDTSELSGGQKQLLHLASVMVMQPKLLILDEPTGQLDPIAASEFLASLDRVHRELGTTVILTEHRLEEALSLATRAAVMQNGRLLCCGSVPEIGAELKAQHHPMFLAMPAAMRIWGSVESGSDCPVSVNEGRTFLTEYTAKHPVQARTDKSRASVGGGDVRVCVSDAWFRYGKELPDVLKNVSLNARAGELFCILGGNGTGKTTALKLLAGLKAPYRGSVKTNGRVCLLPQDPQTLFVKKTVYEDVSDALSDSDLPKEQRAEALARIWKLCRLNGLERRHPYDLSGGEQQRAALAKLLLRNPDILLLDEPTKGLDAQFKTEFASILQELLRTGVCVIMVSHDVEFCAQYADRCALFFDGAIAAQGSPSEFFSGNSFYTTSANRIARGILPQAVTVGQVIDAIGGKPEDAFPNPTVVDGAEPFFAESAVPKKKLPLWRKIGTGISASGAVSVFLYAVKTGKLTEAIDGNGLVTLGREQIFLYGMLFLFVLLTAGLVGKRPELSASVQKPRKKQKLSKRTLAAVAVILLLIPLTLFVGIVCIDRKQYYLTALAVLLECMLPFFLVFEGRRPKARQLVVIAVLCALCIAGRAAFFMLPQCKPVLAMTVLAGVVFGGETGFLVGAVTMLVSNMLFAQGPWTPWQMFAMGLIGFLAGILFRNGGLRRTKASLCVFSALSAVLIYGGIMNPATALIWGSESLNGKMLLSYYLAGLPMDLIHAAASVVFLLLLAEPMLEKLERVRETYGWTE